MFKQFGFENITKSKSAAGLEVILLPDGNYQLNLIILKKQQSSLVTEKQVGPGSWKEVQQLIDPKTPIILIINGKGIIHRKLHRSETDTPASLLSKLLPNATPEDFAVQQVTISKDEVFVSVIRTSVLNELIQELNNHQLTAISACFLGPFVLTDIFPLLEKDVISSQHLHITNFHIQFDGQQIISLNVTTEAPFEHYRIGNDLLAPNLLIAFAGALSYFSGNENAIVNASVLDQLKEEFRQKQKFELRGWSLLVAAFLILMINYFIFNYYWTKNKEMNTQLELTQVALQRYTKLKTDYDQKRLFLEENGLLENSRTSYYADQLAKELPASIQFTGLTIHPQKKKKIGEEDKGFLFENKLIVIAGNCRRNTELNEWMKQIKKQNWVQDLTLLNYRQDNAIENGIFLIEVMLK